MNTPKNIKAGDVVRFLKQIPEKVGKGGIIMARVGSCAKVVKVESNGRLPVLVESVHGYGATIGAAFYCSPDEIEVHPLNDKTPITLNTLTLWEPWASFLVSGIKGPETRPRRLRQFGWMLIHAGQKCVWDFVAQPVTQTLMKRANFNEDILKQRAGKIIGAVKFKDCLPTDSPDCKSFLMPSERYLGDYSSGRFAWIVSEAILFEHGHYASGKQGIWKFDANNLHPQDLARLKKGIAFA